MVCDGIEGCPRDVRGNDDIVKFAVYKRVVLIQRFVFKHVQGRPGDILILQRPDQGGFNYDSAPGIVDEKGGFFHLQKGIPVKHPFG
ncbi:hypothetical protein SDC9_179228 [bioreactor metagenome]|uniref:Uncharacterized protein n=1 Tax=bioreactor metagenome TaxID=1076179 RepID=A0A645H7G7_9ZZZZ